MSSLALPAGAGASPQLALDLSIPVRRARSAPVWSAVQRLGAAAALVALSPLIAVLYVLVRTTSPGPFLFAQRRPGLGGRPFTIYKIRTMAVASERTTALGVTNGSSSVTRLGRILRELKLDELPQLWNIVRGDMELVGPRPIPTALSEELARHIPDFERRYRVAPGLTNVSQVSVVDNELGDRLIADWSLRFEGELHYLHNKSFAYDVLLVGMTGLYVLRKLLRRSPADAGPTAAPANGPGRTLVAGVPIDNVDYGMTVDRMAERIATGRSGYVCVCPVHSIVEARWSPDHLRALRGAAMNVADGMPVVWAQKLFGHRGASRVYGPTLMLEALARAEREGWRVGLLGGRPDRVGELVRRLRERFPGLKIAATICPPFRPMTASEDEALVRQIAEARIDLLWVGLGCPKQERWMHEHAARVDAVMVGVGAAFDFHAGAVAQAPPALQRLGLEWAFRLACEPRRLFKRYATTNPAYVALIARQALSWLRGRAFQLSSPADVAGETASTSA
ncbi:MAG: WecB/TagA/CpsF family glycosyltransferase [Planctomycetota bacterium]